ncbi:beta-microseminoprotein-like [Anomaloglossus baeobatrachus]|uniref:beta-microseminoprotein-like n=1 Tax=Anomaloglossus baeobatrachus TaxID=238106 RepID=UPI003F4FBC60
MAASLLYILVVATMIALCSAQCMTEQNGNVVHNAHTHSAYGQQKNGCWKDGEYHTLGEDWEASDCTKCTCDPDCITCCAKYKQPIFKDKENCVAVLNKKTCEMEVKRKDNSGEACEVDSWVA